MMHKANNQQNHMLMQPLLKSAWIVPVLSSEREQELAYLYKNQGDEWAFDELVHSHVRMVIKIAIKYRPFELPLDDLISEGCMGLVKAVKRFDPDRGFRLSTYARWWIKAAIVEYILNNWSLVRLGTVTAQKNLFFKLRRIKKQLKIPDEGDLDFGQAAKIAELTQTPIEQVVHINRRLLSRDSSLNHPITEGGSELIDLISNDRRSAEEVLETRQERSKIRVVLGEAIMSLQERERQIFVARRLSEKIPTLEQLGNQYGISRERIRQIDKSAYEKIRRFMSRQFNKSVMAVI